MTGGVGGRGRVEVDIAWVVGGERFEWMGVGSCWYVDGG